MHLFVTIKFHSTLFSVDTFTFRKLFLSFIPFYLLIYPLIRIVLLMKKMQFVRAQSQRSLDATMCHSASMRVMCVVFRFTDE